MSHRIAPTFNTALLAASTLTAAPLLADEQRMPAPQSVVAEPVGQTLEAQFRDPPQSARPRVWWHWMNGNVTRDGIAKDMAWMKRVGIGGLQNFDANLQTPQIVDKRLVYMTPEWKEAFAFAAQEADRLGLELAIAASPGWSETGGPWVKPEDGLKKLVWSETLVVGGRRFAGRLAPPPGLTGPFQGLPMQGGIEAMISGEKPPAPPQHYADVAVLALPYGAARSLSTAAVHDALGKRVDAAGLSDDDLEHGVTLPPPGAGNWALVFDYGKPVPVRSASLFIPGGSVPFLGATVLPRLETSDDGSVWREIADIDLGPVPTTLSFSPVTARYFRLTISPQPPRGPSLGSPAPGAAMGDMFAGMVAGAAKRPVTIGDLRLSAEPRVDRFETKAGFALVPDYYALTAPADRSEGVAPGTVLDLTSKFRSDGSLDWIPPKGQWKVLRLGYSLLGTTYHPAPPEATGLEVDKFDGAAVRGYLEHYLGMYRDASGGLIGNRGVRAILTDSIEVGAANWTPKMIAQFTRLRGYDPTPWLPTLTGTLIGTREQTDGFLYDYRRTLADLMASEHYGTVAKVAHEHGLKVYGEALEDKRPSLGDDMAMRRHADVPMAALWTYGSEGPRQTLLADMKGAASVAHIYGQNLVAAESMTAAMAPWAFGPADLKKFIDLEFVNGINRPVIHTSVHVPVDDKQPGLSLFIFGQYFNRNDTWAEMAKPWVDYIARNSLMLQAGRNVADVAYFYGEEAPLTGLFGEKPIADAPKTHAYDFINVDALNDALSNDGNELVTGGGARYKALYLGGSSRRMTLAALRRIAALVEGGATVVGVKPEGDPGLAVNVREYGAIVDTLWPGGAWTQVGKGKVIASTDIEAALTQVGVSQDFAFTGGSADAAIPFVHRRLDDGDSWFLNNRGPGTVTITARFRVTGKAPELWRAETGRTEPLSYRIEGGQTLVPLTLAPGESVHVVFRKPARASSMDVAARTTTLLATLDGPWSVEFEPGRGAPKSVTLPELASLDTSADSRIKYFSGVATYSKSFAAPNVWKRGQPLWLDLGEAREIAEAAVNGKSAGSVWHAPYRLDIGALVKPGRNTLEIKVANLWVNRLIGDAQPGAQKITWTTMPTYMPDAPLRKSGLIGPVVLLGSAEPAR